MSLDISVKCFAGCPQACWPVNFYQQGGTGCQGFACYDMMRSDLGLMHCSFGSALMVTGGQEGPLVPVLLHLQLDVARRQ